QLGRLADAASVGDLYGELYSDNTVVLFTYGDISGAADETISNYSIRASNQRIQSAWDQTYNAIFICNNIINQVEKTPLDISEELKSRWISETLVVRSLAYFNLVRVFGEVPLVLDRISTEEAYDYLRENTQVIYDQIVSDLTKAKASLPESYTG